MKQRVIAAVATVGGPENDRWLHSVVRNTNEPLELRSAALTAANRNDMPIPEMATLYDNLAERPLREQLINSFARRKEPEATDKLIDIARTGTDPVIRRSAIAALTRKNDPRTTALLLEIVDR